MKGRYTSTAMIAAAGVLMATPALAQWTFQIGDSGGASATIGGDDDISVFSLGCSPDEPDIMDFVVALPPSVSEGPDDLTLTITIGGDDFTLTTSPIIWDEGFVPMISTVPWEGDLQDQIRARLRSGSRVTIAGEGLETTTFSLRGSSAALRELESTCLEFFANPTTAPTDDDGDDDGGGLVAGRAEGDWEILETDEGGGLTFLSQANGTIFALECGGPVMADHIQLAMLVPGTETETTPVQIEYLIDDEPFTANASILPQGEGDVIIGTQYPYNELIRDEVLGPMRQASTVTLEGGEGFEGATFELPGIAGAVDEVVALCLELGHISAAGENEDDAPDRPPVVAGREDEGDWEFSANSEDAFILTRAGGNRVLGLECIPELVENHLQIAVIVRGSETGETVDTFTFEIDGERYTANAEFFPQDDGETILMSTQYAYNDAFRDLILDGFRNGSTFELIGGARYEGFEFDISRSGSAVDDVEAACIRLGYLTPAADDGGDTAPPRDTDRDDTPVAREEGNWVLDVEDDSALVLVEAEDGRAFGLNCVDNDPGVMRIFAYIRGGLLVPNDAELNFSFDGSSYTGTAETVRDEGDIVGFIARYEYDDPFRENILGDLSSAREAAVGSPVAREDYTFDVAGVEPFLPRLDAACADLWGTEPILGGAADTPPARSPDGGRTKGSNGIRSR